MPPSGGTKTALWHKQTLVMKPNTSLGCQRAAVKTDDDDNDDDDKDDNKNRHTNNI